jgi:Fe-S-cluster containining protein
LVENREVTLNDDDSNIDLCSKDPQQPSGEAPSKLDGADPKGFPGGPFISLQLLPIDEQAKKKKRDPEYWSKSWIPQINKEREPHATRHLNRQTMCGACQFKCCYSTIFGVEVSEEQRQRLGLEQLTWQIAGHCYCLKKDENGNVTGCKFGKDRPSVCKLFPLQIDFEKQQIYTPHWVLTHCPTPKDFEFVEMRDGKYVYKKRDGVKGPKKNNMQEEIVIDYPIEEWPNILEANAEGLEELYGAEMVDRVRGQLVKLNKVPGFPLDDPNNPKDGSKETAPMNV